MQYWDLEHLVNDDSEDVFDARRRTTDWLLRSRLVNMRTYLHFLEWVQYILLSGREGLFESFFFE